MSRIRRFRSFARHPLEQAEDVRRRRGREQTPVWLGFENGRDRVRRGFAGERRLPGQHFEQHAPEGPDVGSLVHRLPPGLLGAHIGGGSEDGAFDRGALNRRRECRVVGDRLRQPEIEDLHHAVGCKLDVGRLEIAVNDSLFMRGVECVGNLLRDDEGLADRQRAALHALTQRLAFDPRRAMIGMRLNLGRP
jgi:hypothetical protein